MKTKKTGYRLRNWKQYNRSLMGRGSLTLWIDEEVIQNWKTPVKTGQPGASKTYSDVCITACLSLGLVMKLPLRQCCGLVCSVLALMGVNLPCPDPSTLSRRRRGLCVDMGVKASPCSESCPSEGRHIVVDSTGLKMIVQQNFCNFFGPS